jgi:UDP-N-acetylglucosamine--N-acetylmuramyl-(pentapeptide) pyrophosphoryl-undecaprenol N-acetylglucosamine transferase
MLKRVLFAGGGTGGHVYLAVSIREELRSKDPDCECRFIGTEKGMEMQILPPLEFPLETIQIGGLKNVGLAKTLKSLLQIPGSLFQAWKIVKGFRPSVIVGLGGYSSGPVVLVGSLAGFPSILIEPNVIPGLANRLVGRFVSGAAVAFPETGSYFRTKASLTGIPVRPEFHQIEPKGQIDLPLNVLVFGGSRGSVDLNRMICESLPWLDPTRFSIHHQTGAGDLDRVKRHYEDAHFPGILTAYMNDMPEQFRWSDLIISRAGACTVAEITAAGRPAILIPFPYAADDHQKKNALALQSRQAAIVLDQFQTTGQDLATHLNRLADNRGRLCVMAKASHGAAQRQSATRIIELMEKVIPSQP